MQISHRFGFNKFINKSFWSQIIKKDLSSLPLEKKVYIPAANFPRPAENYITTAFRSFRKNEAYLFIADTYVVLDYVSASRTTDHKVVPIRTWDGLRSLRHTLIEDKVDCTFRSASEDEAFFFYCIYCAVVDYKLDSLKKGPMRIIDMFPFLEGTVFKNFVGAAFETTNDHEAYLFNGNQYALINYGPEGRLINHGLITQGFPSLRGTIFESGIDAAFASHNHNEAYIFKGDSYALINFHTASTADCIIGGVNKILTTWPSLSCILPHNGGTADCLSYLYTTSEDWSDEDDLNEPHDGSGPDFLAYCNTMSEDSSDEDELKESTLLPSEWKANHGKN